jgi:TetR/AcrR family transcriptional repressor of nem operon
MKVSKAQAAENRQGILDAAARLYRERGLTGVGVADITRDAGLTHGGLYRHFASKDALVQEACARAFDWSMTPLDGARPNTTVCERIQSYLSPQHRDAPGQGCPVAALAVDAARAGGELSEVFAEGIERNIVRFAQLLAADRGDAVSGHHGRRPGAGPRHRRSPACAVGRAAGNPAGPVDRVAGRRGHPRRPGQGGPSPALNSCGLRYQKKRAASA